MDYCLPTSTDEAIEILAYYDGKALVVAGGTDVMPDVRHGKKSPRALVDITRIPGIDRITVDKSCVEAGAGVTFGALAAHPYLQAHVHALAQAAASVGAHGIQRAATWAGNLVQAMPAADGAIVALVLDAEVLVHNARGANWRPASTLFAGPGISTIDPTRALISRIRFAIPGGPWGTAWGRVGRRASLVLPILNCATKLELVEGKISAAAIALGPVGPIPKRATTAEACLQGQTPCAPLFVEAARLAQLESNPRSSRMRASREYRLDVLPLLVEEALNLAAQRAQEHAHAAPEPQSEPNKES